MHGCTYARGEKTRTEKRERVESINVVKKRLVLASRIVTRPLPFIDDRYREFRAGRFNEEATKPPSFPPLPLSIFFPTRAEGRMTYRPSTGRAYTETDVHHERPSPLAPSRQGLFLPLDAHYVKRDGLFRHESGARPMPLSDRVFTSHQDDDVGRCRRRPRATISRRPGAIFPATPADSMIDAFRIGSHGWMHAIRQFEFSNELLKF